MHDDMIENIKMAVGAHGGWLVQLNTAIATGTSKKTGDEAACHKSCAFGTWLESTGIKANYAATDPYKVIYRLHREFHAAAGDVTDLVLAGHLQEAKALLDGELTARSQKLVRGMQKWMQELQAQQSRAA